MPNRKFAVGDRVVAIAEHDDNTSIIGVAGTILAIEGYRTYAVEYDELISKGHDLRGKCKNGYGWFTDGECLELLNEEIVLPADAHMSYDEVMA